LIFFYFFLIQQDHQDNVVDSTEPDLYDAMVTAAADSTEEVLSLTIVFKKC